MSDAAEFTARLDQCDGDHGLVLDVAREAVAKVAELEGKVSLAYGYLWHVNNEPGTPMQYSAETAAYSARRALRDLLTTEQRGIAINSVRHEIHGCKVPPAGWICTREPGHAGPCAAIEQPHADGVKP